MIELNHVLPFALTSCAIAKVTDIFRIAIDATAAAPDDTSMEKPPACPFELARNNQSLLRSENVSNQGIFFSGYADLNR